MKSTFGGIGGSGDIDSKIDSAFSRSSPFAKSHQEGASKSSISERVLAGHEKFGNQFSQRSAPQIQSSSSQSGRSEEFGRFGDPDAEFKSNPLEFNDDLDRMEPPKPPPPLQIRRDVSGQQGIGSNNPPSFTSSPQASSLQDMNKPVGFPDSSSNVPEQSIDSATNQGRELTYTEKRIFDEIEDIRAQNNEILRRIQRMESKLR